MADTDHRTGQEIIGKINKDVLRELYVQEEIVEDYLRLRDIIKEGAYKESIQAIKLLWEFTIEKPKQSVDNNVTLPSLLDIPDGKLKEILNKIDVRKPDQAGEAPTNTVQA